MKKKNQTIIKSIIISVVSVLFFYLCTVSFLKPLITKVFTSTNLSSYALSIIFFLILFILSGKINITLSKNLISAGFLLISILLLISCSLEIRDVKYPIIEFSFPTYVFLAAIIFLFLVVSIIFFNEKLNKRWHDGLNRFTGIITWVLASALIAVSAYNQYNLNFFRYFDHHHLHAYLNSILNVYHGQPFTETITSIYGHYGFFYYPFLKIAYHFGAHNIYKVYMLLSSLLTVCILLIWIRILCWNIKSPLLLLTGIFTICHINAARIVFLFHQLYPHRALPVAVTALLISLWFRSKGKRRFWITICGYVTGIMLISWNTECGIVSVISWAALHICSAFQSKAKKNIMEILIHLSAIPLTFCAAVVFCGLINCMFGGEMISVRDFLFPLLNTGLMIEFHELPLPPYPSAWMFILLLIFAFLGYGLKDTIFCTAAGIKSDRTAACFALAVLGLGALSYPINRPAYTEFYIILPIAGLLMSITADSFWKDIPVISKPSAASSANQLLRGYLAYLSFFILFLLTISTIINIPHKLNEYKRYKDTEKIDTLAAWIIDINNDKALAIGNTASFIYAYLGRDPGFYYMDTSDYIINPISREELIENLKYLDGESVFTANDVQYDLPQEFLDTHWEYSMIKIDNFPMYYWVPK